MDNDTEISELTIKMWTELLERAFQEDTAWPKTFVPTVMVIIFVVSVVGNSITCIVIYSDKTMHTLTNYYLFNLAVSDLLVTFTIPLVVHEQIHSDYLVLHFSFGDMACKIHFFLIMMPWNNCILVMTALTIERYLAICHPLVLQNAPACRRAVKVIAIVWVVAIVETLPEMSEMRLIKTKSASMCLIAPTYFAKVVNVLLAIVTFVVPLGIMTFVYAMIAFQVNVVQRNTSKGRIFNKRNNRSRINKLILALTVAFLVCWAPFFTIRICMFVFDARRLLVVDEWWIYLWRVCALNTWFSCVLNPLLFSVMSTKFQHSLKALWNRHFRRRQFEASVLEHNTNRTTTNV